MTTRTLSTTIKRNKKSHIKKQTLSFPHHHSTWPHQVRHRGAKCLPLLAHCFNYQYVSVGGCYWMEKTRFLGKIVIFVVCFFSAVVDFFRAFLSHRKSNRSLSNTHVLRCMHACNRSWWISFHFLWRYCRTRLLATDKSGWTGWGGHTSQGFTTVNATTEPVAQGASIDQGTTEIHALYVSKFILLFAFCFLLFHAFFKAFMNNFYS